MTLPPDPGDDHQVSPAEGTDASQAPPPVPPPQPGSSPPPEGTVPRTVRDVPPAELIPPVMLGSAPAAATMSAPGEAGPGLVMQRPTHKAVARPKARHPASFLRELPVLLLIAVVLALLIKQFLVQAFFIPTGSMEQTLHIHDRVLVNKVSYHLRDPHRGEIVVFNTSGTGFAGQGGEFARCPRSNVVVSGIREVQRFLGVGTCGAEDYIKRIIAVPGDTVQCCDSAGHVVVNGHSLVEPYVYQDNQEAFCAAPPGSFRPALTFNQCGAGAMPIKVPPRMYWVMGDHRDDSADSRPNGFVPRSKIVGRAFVRVWPITRIGFLNVPETFQHAQTAALIMGSTPAALASALTVPLVGLRLVRRRRRRAAR